MKASDIKKQLHRTPVRRPSPADYLSWGSTLLNLACTGKPFCGLAKGYYYFVVGDSASGKTFLVLTCLAEAAINKRFGEYRFIYDATEGGALMDIKRFFGSGVYNRIEPPAIIGDYPVYSQSIEDFYYHMDDAIAAGMPFIYILDSMDALTSDAERDKFQEQKRDSRKGKELTGSYGDGKAKINASGIRQLLKPLQDSGSILIVVNQTRDNLGFGFEKKTRSGGHALRFYATIEMWSRPAGKITRTVKGKPRQQGIHCEVKIKKNRLSGQEHTVEFPIYHSFGIDDVGSCVDYLIDEGHWERKKGSKTLYVAKEFKVTATREKLIRTIEQRNLERSLRLLVGETWTEITKAAELQGRKKRY